MKKSPSPKGQPQKSASASQLIDARIRELGGWRGEMVGRLRAAIRQANQSVQRQAR